MRRPLAAVMLAGIAIVGMLPSNAAATQRRRSPSSALTGRVLVLLRPVRGRRAQAAALRAVIARAHAQPAGLALPQIGLLTVRPASGESPAMLISRLRALPAVQSATPERRLRLRFRPNDPALVTPEIAVGTAPGTMLQWAPAREDAFAAWDITDGAGALVAVIDTGVDGSHPELAGKLAAAVDQDATPGDGPATFDEVGHGTHVASLACAATNDGIAIVGMGYDCRLIIEKSDLSESSVAASIVDATDRGAEAINMSFGDSSSADQSPTIVRAIEYAYSHNVVLVAAAADSPVQEQGEPANILQPLGTGANLTEGLGLSVTSADSTDHRSYFAGLGSEISLAAYGSDQTSGGPPGLLGAFPANQTQLDGGSAGPPPGAPCGCRTTVGGDSRYAYLQGTSMAAPQVAAVAALMRNLNPDMTAFEVIETLKRTARRPAGSGWTPDLGWGILDAGAAVVAAHRMDLRAPVATLRLRGHPSRGIATLTVQARDRAPLGVTPAGLREIDVYVSVDGARPRRILRIVVQTVGRVTATRRIAVRLRGHGRYAFFAIAIDRAGNRERRPRRPQVSLLA